MKKICFVHNFSTHYTKTLFEILSTHHTIKFLFFNKGKTWYWQESLGTQEGTFDYTYTIPKIFLGIKINFDFIKKIFVMSPDIYISGISGKFEMPFTFFVAKLKRKPFIIWTGIWVRLDTKFHRFFFPIYKFILKKSDAIVVYGSHVKKYLISEGIKPEKIFLANHAIDNSFYNILVPINEIDKIKNVFNISKESKIILYLGRLEEIKGVKFLIKALVNLPIDYICIIAGTGSEDENLRNLVSELNLGNRVIFTGFVPIDQTRLFYSISNVYVLPSITTKSGKETWGLTINEALNQSIPIITTKAVGAAAGGLVKNGFNGLIVNEQCPDEITKAIEIILNPKNFMNYKKNAYLSIQNWTQEEMAKGFFEAIEYVCKI